MYWVKKWTSICAFSQLEVNDHLNDRGSREVHTNDTKALVLVYLSPQVVIQRWIYAKSDRPGVCKYTSTTAVGEKNLGHVSSRCSLQVVIDTLPFLLHIQKGGYLQGTAKVLEYKSIISPVIYTFKYPFKCTQILKNIKTTCLILYWFLSCHQSSSDLSRLEQSSSEVVLCYLPPELWQYLHQASVSSVALSHPVSVCLNRDLGSLEARSKAWAESCFLVTQICIWLDSGFNVVDDWCRWCVACPACSTQRKQTIS